MKYKASLDTLAKIITIAIAALFIFIGQIFVREILEVNGDAIVIGVNSLLMILFLAIFFGCWLFAPHSYSIDENDLMINRPFSNLKIQLADILKIRVLEKNEMRWALRTFGVGGLFGYYGKFYDSKIGNVTMYATQRKNRILIQTKEGKKIIITPDDLELAEKLSGYATR